MFQSNSELVSSLLVALESIHAALAVMAHTDMPKQLYKEEVSYLCASSKYYYHYEQVNCYFRNRLRKRKFNKKSSLCRRKVLFESSLRCHDVLKLLLY